MDPSSSSYPRLAGPFAAQDLDPVFTQTNPVYDLTGEDSSDDDDDDLSDDEDGHTIPDFDPDDEERLAELEEDYDREDEEDEDEDDDDDDEEEEAEEDAVDAYLRHVEEQRQREDTQRFSRQQSLAQVPSTMNESPQSTTSSQPDRKRRWTAGSDDPYRSTETGRGFDGPSSSRAANTSAPRMTTVQTQPSVAGVSANLVPQFGQPSLPQSTFASPTQYPNPNPRPDSALPSIGRMHSGSRAQSFRTEDWTPGPPRWQPDAEVASCPICHRPFGLFYRKHHCRKCGRVVCANCSPHRITIPRQFIVQPPGTPNNQSTPITPLGQDGNRIDFVDLTGDDNGAPTTPNRYSHGLPQTPQQDINSFNPALGGGEEVRLCNPCVPDPNPEPPPNYRSLSDENTARPWLGSTGTWSGSQSTPWSSSVFNPTPPLSRDFGAIGAIGPPSNTSNPDGRLFPSNRHSLGSSSGLFGLGDPSATPGRSWFEDTAMARQRAMASGSPAGRSGTMLRSAGQGLATGLEPPGYQASVGGYRNQNASGSISRGYTVNPAALSGSMAAAAQQGPPTGHRRTVSHAPTSQYQSPRPQPRIRETDLCPICARILPPIDPSTGSEEAREAHIRACIEQRDPGTTASATASSMQHRMLVFSATEKDCLATGSGSTNQECSICMEEYEVGEDLARLECLCKFHKRCIVDWFERKQECPVHKS